MGSESTSVLLSGLAAIVGGLLVIWSAYRGSHKTLPRGHWLGMRTTASVSSDEAWAAMHRVGAPYAYVGGIGLLIAGVATVLANSPETSGYALLIGCGWVMCWILVGSMLGNRAAQRVQKASDQRG